MTSNPIELPIRKDLLEAIDRAWIRLGRPGTWLTGEERVGIADEARAAKMRDLGFWKEAAHPPISVADSWLEKLGGLADLVVGLVHRIATEASRLTEEDYRSALDRGLTDGQYVEIVGTVATIAGIDSFHRALGLSLRELPNPIAGEPSRRRPTGAQSGGAWVPMVERSDLDPEDAGLYTKDRDGYVIRALSLVPDEVRSLIDQSQNFYVRDLSNLAEGRSLSRPQIEMIASRVSALNECFY
ncbi:MAG: hypothetical protein CL467_02485 [Acidimicrobiaceae bacterium]|nr:hypothetical protein [Acidimicrobiaceae bacterium]|tara:strand:- start:3836 stop:4561 length:726 start_codon:yes stop_codon:yes gene_type:complete